MSRTVIGGRDLTTDVAIQDQETPPVSYFLTKALETITLGYPTAVGNKVIVLKAGHSVAVGNMINIREGAFICQCQVVGVNVNALMLDRPMDHAFTIGATINRATKNLAVDGSVTPQEFILVPPPAVKWHVVGFSVHIVDNLELDDTKFGGIAALTNGLVMRAEVGGAHANIGVAKTNGDLFMLLSEGVYSDKAGAGGYAGFWSGLIRERLGVVVILDGANEDSIQVVVQDAIDAITTIEVVVQGHVVLD